MEDSFFTKCNVNNRSRYVYLTDATRNHRHMVIIRDHCDINPSIKI